MAISHQPYPIPEFRFCLLSPKAGFFYSAHLTIGKIQMSLSCPYCQSRDTVLLQSPHYFPINPSSNSNSNSAMSPMALAALGVSISKSLNLPPIAGALVGVLIGGVWMLMTEDDAQRSTSPISIQHYYCNDCDRDFSPNIRNSSF